jgi:glucuronate isomerase
MGHAGAPTFAFNLPFSPAMPSFIHDDFLLHTAAARDLYHGFAEREPIYDYHCHLPPALIADNHCFGDLFEIWLGGDHYKWRAMRTNGVAERLCTGDASPREKFNAWCATVPQTLRNPLYHWSHLELKRYFGIDLAIGPATADAIWQQAAGQLTNLRVHDILAANRVAVICTTDDPADSLETHQRIRKSGLKTRVYPAFRPDKALAVDNAAAFNAWLERLGTAAGTTARSFDDLLVALKKRHDDFHAAGCRLSDHGLEVALSEPCTPAQAFRPERHARRDDALRLVPHAGVWSLGRAPGLDQAAPPRRDAEQQLPPVTDAGAGHRLRLYRGFPAGPGAGALPRRTGCDG